MLCILSLKGAARAFHSSSLLGILSSASSRSSRTFCSRRFQLELPLRLPPRFLAELLGAEDEEGDVGDDCAAPAASPLLDEEEEEEPVGGGGR